MQKKTLQEHKQWKINRLTLVQNIISDPPNVAVIFVVLLYFCNFINLQFLLFYNFVILNCNFCCYCINDAHSHYRLIATLLLGLIILI